MIKRDLFVSTITIKLLYCWTVLVLVSLPLLHLCPNVAVLTEDVAFALFLSLRPGGFDSSRVPTLGNLPSKAKKMLFPGGQPGEGRLGATGNDWCIIQQEELKWHPSGVKRTTIRVIGVNFSLFYQGKRYLVRVSGEFELSNEFWINRVKVTKKWG